MQGPVGTGEGGEMEGVVTVDVDVFAHVRREPGHVFVSHRVALGAQAGQGSVEVHRGPQRDAVEDQAESAELASMPSR